MANNRLYLVADGVRRPDGSAGWLCLAKFYPSTGWYRVARVGAIDAFFKSLGPAVEDSLFGTECRLRLELDSDTDPTGANAILVALDAAVRRGPRPPVAPTSIPQPLRPRKERAAP